MKPKNLELYEKVKKDVDKIYEKPSAYKSMYIIKEYKKRGGEFYDDDKPKLLKRWMEEEWKDIGNKNWGSYIIVIFRKLCLVFINKRFFIIFQEI